MSTQALESPRAILQEMAEGKSLWLDKDSECVALAGEVGESDAVVYLPDFRLLLKRGLIEAHIHHASMTRYRLTAKARSFVG